MHYTLQIIFSIVPSPIEFETLSREDRQRLRRTYVARMLNSRVVTALLEWFINPDHLPFIVGLDKSLYKKNNIELEIIEPEGHYDGFKELAQNNIQLALSLIHI